MRHVATQRRFWLAKKPVAVAEAKRRRKPRGLGLKKLFRHAFNPSAQEAVAGGSVSFRAPLHRNKS